MNAWFKWWYEQQTAGMRSVLQASREQNAGTQASKQKAGRET